MRIVEYLADPDVRPIYVQALLAGLAVVGMCGVLSVLVVVKRLGFVGQGVSHSAFGGIGVAALLAALGLIPPTGIMQLLIVVLFCVAAALGMASVSDRKTVPVDTSIGIFLVGSMALGAVLVQESREIASAGGRGGSVQSWEAILFGSILVASPSDTLIAWVIGAGVMAAAWWWRRPMLFWALDEDTARAFGVSTPRMKLVLMVLLSLAVVVAMKLAGVVLATALLVLPAATALKLSRKIGGVTALSVSIGVVGLVAGLVLSAELGWQAGPSVVIILTLLFASVVAYERILGVRRSAGDRARQAA